MELVGGAAEALGQLQGQVVDVQRPGALDPTHHGAFAKYSPETAAGFPNPSYPDLFVTPEVYHKQMGFAVESMYHFVDCIQDQVSPLASGADGLLTDLVEAVGVVKLDPQRIAALQRHRGHRHHHQDLLHRLPFS